MKSLGQIGYEAYCDQTEWKSAVSGADLPNWEAVKDEIKAAWEASAGAVSKEVPRYDLGVPEIARVCHEVERAYGNRFCGDVHPHWIDVPGELRESCMKRVQFFLDHTGADAGAYHERWREIRAAEGWSYGKVRDDARKLDPRMVSFAELSDAQQVKGIIFHAIVRYLSR